MNASNRLSNQTVKCLISICYDDQHKKKNKSENLGILFTHENVIKSKSYVFSQQELINQIL